jgi:hypothetical protein
LREGVEVHLGHAVVGIQNEPTGKEHAAQRTVAVGWGDTNKACGFKKKIQVYLCMPLSSAGTNEEGRDEPVEYTDEFQEEEAIGRQGEQQPHGWHTHTLKEQHRQ